MTSPVGSLARISPPPSDSTYPLVHPVSTLSAIQRFNVVLLTLVSMTTFIRIYTRYSIVKSVAWASDTIILAYLSFITYFALLHKLFDSHAGMQKQDFQISEMPDFVFWRWICEIFYCVCIASVRLTLCLQFMHLFIVGRTTPYWIATFFVSVNMTYYTCHLFVAVFQCRPVAKLWNPQLNGSCNTALDERSTIATGFFNLVSDLLMLAFSLHCIWGLQAPREFRLTVCGLFMVGLLAVIASISSLVYSFMLVRSQDPTFTFMQVAECAFGEVGAGILVSNLILLPGFLSHVGKNSRAWIVLHWPRDRVLSQLYRHYDKPVTEDLLEAGGVPHSAGPSTTVPLDESESMTC